MMDLSHALSQQPAPVARRSMMLNHNEFEKLYFRQPNQQRQEEYNGNHSSSHPQSTRGLNSQVPMDFLRRQQDLRNPEYATIVMPINFEGSNSLKAESVFLTVNEAGKYQNINSSIVNRTFSTGGVQVLHQASGLRKSTADLRGSHASNQVPL